MSSTIVINASTISVVAKTGAAFLNVRTPLYTGGFPITAGAINSFLAVLVNDNPLLIGAVTINTQSSPATAGFGTTGTLLIGTEQITYTGLGATSFTGCTRGANGSVAAAHPKHSVIADCGGVQYLSPVIAIDGPIYGAVVGPMSDFDRYTVGFAQELDVIADLKAPYDAPAGPYNGPIYLPTLPLLVGGGQTAGSVYTGFSTRRPWVYPLTPQENTPPQIEIGVGDSWNFQSYFGGSSPPTTNFPLRSASQTPVLDLMLLLRPLPIIPQLRVTRQDQYTKRIAAADANEYILLSSPGYGRRYKTFLLTNFALNTVTYRVTALNFNTNNPGFIDGANLLLAGDPWFLAGSNQEVNIFTGTLAAGASVCLNTEADADWFRTFVSGADTTTSGSCSLAD